MQDTVAQRIEALVRSHRTVLFMKGSRGAPQCGFSAQVVEILDKYLPEYETVNVLADPEVREGIKQFSSWPTIPQLYVDGEFIGGCDIVRELDGSGELLATLGDQVAAPSEPTITATPAALATFHAALADAAADEQLRITISPRFEHDLSLEPPRAGDVVVALGDVALRLDPASARRADGLQIDYLEQPSPGFRLDNPNAPPSVRSMSARELAAALGSAAAPRLIDVRTPQEWDTARIPGAELLDQRLMFELAKLPKDTALVFHCHHGRRSLQAAQHFVGQGFRRVYNLEGGIDAWSTDVDPAVPRY
jgi:monothiol glutaredoxin